MNAQAFDKFRLDGELALVTGASSGLGVHFARLLADAGARVAVAARRTDKLHSLVDAITVSGGTARAMALDVTDSASVERCFDELADWGPPGILVNNAGVTVTKPLLQQNEEDWDLVMDTNLKGAWLVATEGARRLVAAGHAGCIVNVASILGERVAGGVAPYAISKAGVVQATKAMALELASTTSMPWRRRLAPPRSSSRRACTSRQRPTTREQPPA
jgi:NAD(P)-dependent dehydrogenase (short-subunit alcohol dehydrogenase family)